MLLKRFYDDKLAQASYLVGCQASGTALVVDPTRQADGYLKAARDEGLRITHVTETHIHADFVSGARELAHRAGARLHLSDAGGPEWRYAFAKEAGAELLQDGSCFSVGNVDVSVLHTPGHTPEHVSLLVTDTATASGPMGAFTGDFLFVGDVGRPDLLERAAKLAGTMEIGARQLFRSLQRFRDLPDYLQIWPGHGAGSACGKALGAVPQSVLGYEKRFNWAFGIADEDEFVRAVLAGQPDPPRYFAQMKRINREGPPLLDGARRPPRLEIEELARALEGGATVVDTRPATDYAAAAIPGTLNIPAGRSFTTWAGWLLSYDRDFYLIVRDNRADAVKELLRDLYGIGLDRVSGYAEAGAVEDWRGGGRPVHTLPAVDAAQVQQLLRDRGAVVLDVRAEGEWAAGHLPGARHLPLGELDQRLDEIPRGGPIIVHCQSGSRAAIAASLLRARGYDDVRQYRGGFGEWRAAGHPVELPHT
jgi:hydroxyacylglutathione hydrolase